MELALNFQMTIIRMAAAVAAIVFYLAFSPGEYMSLYWAILASHFLFAAIGILLAQRSDGSPSRVSFLSLGLFLILGLPAMVWSFPPILFYFSLHHAFNEVLGLEHRYRGLMKSSRLFTGSRILLALAGYFFLLRKRWLLAEVSPVVWWSVFVISALIFVFCFMKEKSREWAKNNPAVLRDTFWFEIVGVVIILALSPFKLKFEDIVFYHILFWILYSTRFVDLRFAENRSWRMPVFRWIALMVLVPAIFLPMTPAFGMVGGFEASSWMVAMTAIGHLHISASLCFSKLFRVS